MKTSRDAFTMCRNMIVVIAIVVTMAAMVAPELMTFRVSGLRMTPFDLMAVTVPVLILLFVFECVRAIVRTVGIRRQVAASDQRFYDEFRRRSEEQAKREEEPRE